MIDRQIDLLNKQIEKLNAKDFDLDGWKSSTIVILSRIFGEPNQRITAIEKIEFRSGGWATSETSNFWDNMDSCKKQGKDILEACITELETFGPPKPKAPSNSGVNINLTQNSNQTVNVNLIVSALEDELTVSQLRAINDIMKSNESKSEKRKRIIDKLKKFGKDVSSNVLANILTNPTIWS